MAILLLQLYSKLSFYYNPSNSYPFCLGHLQYVGRYYPIPGVLTNPSSTDQGWALELCSSILEAVHCVVWMEDSRADLEEEEEGIITLNVVGVASCCCWHGEVFFEFGRQDDGDDDNGEDLSLEAGSRGMTRGRVGVGGGADPLWLRPCNSLRTE